MPPVSCCLSLDVCLLAVYRVVTTRPRDNDPAAPGHRRRVIAVLSVNDPGCLRLNS
jgi:hypothetical protein